MKTRGTSRKGGRRSLRLRSFFNRLRISQSGDRGVGAEPICRGFVLREDGSNILEMAIVCAVYFAMLFGIIQFCLVFYAYHFVAEAAREATRYAVIRGEDSCTISATFPNCNLLPTTSGNPLQTYVQGLGYPYATKMTVTATWWEPTQSSSTPPATSWTTACTTALDSSGRPCNAPGNAVLVTVTYNFPISVPYWKSTTIQLNSASEMMISE
jgi:Flp pilus assembly protein TadG